MKTIELRKIATRYFSDYPIFINFEAMHQLIEAYQLHQVEVHEIFRSLKYNIHFFEQKGTTQYGLLNLFMYALDAMFIDETKWDYKRKDVTLEYKHLLIKQEIFFNLSSIN